MCDDESVCEFFARKLNSYFTEDKDINESLLKFHTDRYHVDHCEGFEDREFFLGIIKLILEKNGPDCTKIVKIWFRYYRLLVWVRLELLGAMFYTVMYGQIEGPSLYILDEILSHKNPIERPYIPKIQDLIDQAKLYKNHFMFEYLKEHKMILCEKCPDLINGYENC